MPRYKFAFPINNAVFEDKDLSFQVADVSFVTKSYLSKDSFFYKEVKLPFSENHIFAVTIVCGNKSDAAVIARDKCCLATDIFKICSDLYHNNICNSKKWQFDLNTDFVTQAKSYFFYKELDSDYPENNHAEYHANRYNAYVNTKVIESVSKWNIKDFELLHHTIYSADVKTKSIHNVLKRACQTYSQSFSINKLHERVVLLCTVLDTLVTNERGGKVPQLQKYLPTLVLINDRLTEDLNNFIEYIYEIRSAYIHNAEEKNISEKDVDKLEKIVYRVVLQMVRNSTKYPSTKEICAAIDKGVFEPITDNLPDIYIPKTQHIPSQYNNIDCPCSKECPRHGHCRACLAHHKAEGTKLPACLRGIEWER